MDKSLNDYVKTADWKSEKHVPAIAAPAKVAAGETFEVEVSVGKEIPHPNTIEQHIVWIALHFVPEGSPVSEGIGRVGLSSHGSVASTASAAKFSLALQKGGEFHATAYCNLHGLWLSSCPARARRLEDKIGENR